MSDLRRQRQAGRISKVEASRGKLSIFQRGCTWSEELLLLCLAAWAYVKWGARYISPVVTVSGLMLVAIIFVALHFLLRKFPQKWSTGDQIESFRQFPEKGL